MQGRAAEAADTVLQRLKSLEMIAGGTSCPTAQKVELPPPPEPSIGSRQELQLARREARLDQEVKGGGAHQDKGKTKGKEKGRDKGKEKGKGKGKEADSKKTS